MWPRPQKRDKRAKRRKTKSNALTCFRNVAVAHRAHRRPEDSNTDFKHQESREDDQLILQKQQNLVTSNKKEMQIIIFNFR